MRIRILVLSFAVIFLSIRLRSILPRPQVRSEAWCGRRCDSPAGEASIRDRVFPGTKDCPVKAGRRPLIVISHGRTGWAGGHHDTAAALADAGFIVAAIDHPIDSGASKTSRIEDIAYLAERPADIMRLIDFMLGASPFAASVDPARVGFFGFSRGAYTGLVLVGGKPNGELAQAACAASSTAGTLCEQNSSRQVSSRLRH